VKITLLIALVGTASLVGYETYRQVAHRDFTPPVLHSAPIVIASRPSTFPDLIQRYPEIAPAQVAIFLSNADDDGEGAGRCLQAMGVPFFVTRDLTAALRHELVLLYPEVDGRTFTIAQAQSVSDYVARGGVVFATDVSWGGFKPLFGFEDMSPLRTRHKIVFEASGPDSDPIMRYLNRPEERQVPLGSSDIREVIWTNGYRASKGTHVLAHFEDGSAALLWRDLGRGHAYLLGASLTDLVVRNQQNRDFEAQRIYANSFEPGTDVWMLLLRAWYEAYSSSGLRLGTIPEGKRSVLMLSHDVDWEHSFQPMIAFAAFEKNAGISSTVFVQTKYLDDANSHAFFFGSALDVLRTLVQGSDLGSHSVIHSKLFNKVPLGTGDEKYPTYRSRATRDNPAQDTTALGEVCVSKSLLDGELPGHETIFFRAGHLRVPPFLPEALVRCGYEFDSSFTAGDVLTNFPYELDFDLAMSGPTGIFEFPVTFEDEQSPPLLQRVPAILKVIEANAENGAVSVILIHSNDAQDKLAAERALISQLPQDILVENMTAYALFWKARSRLLWSSRPLVGGEDVEIDSDLPIAGLTLVSMRKVAGVSGVPGIRWTEQEVILPKLAGKSQFLIHIDYAPNWASPASLALPQSPR
jgi:hypothetical protein